MYDSWMSLKCICIFYVDVTKLLLYRASEEDFLGTAGKDFWDLPPHASLPSAGRSLAAESHPSLTW